MSVTTSTAQGQRSTQEDRFIVQATSYGTLMAVMDGHGGFQAAEACRKRLPETWERQEAQLTFDGTIDWILALSNTVSSLGRQLADFSTGTTLSIVFIPDGEEIAYCAVIGDSPIVIRDENGRLIIGPEHNVRTNLIERQEALGRGAVYDKGYIMSPRGNGLQMSRALGDAEFDGILSRRPEIFLVPLGKSSFVLLASDGLVDPAHLDTKAALSTLIDLLDTPTTSAHDLVDYAANIPTGDNVTAVLWRPRNSVGISPASARVFSDSEVRYARA